MEWLICSIFSSSIVAATRTHWWASLTRAIIPSYKSCFAAVNSLYVQQFAAVNSVQGSGQGTSAGNCLCSPSSCVDGCLSWRHSLMESSISLQRCSSVAPHICLSQVASAVGIHPGTGLLCLLGWHQGK